MRSVPKSEGEEGLLEGNTRSKAMDDNDSSQQDNTFGQHTIEGN